MKHKWLWWVKDDVMIEKIQATQEGRDITGVKNKFDSLTAENISEDSNFQARVNQLLDEVQNLPMKQDFQFDEPSDLEEIQAARPETRGIRRKDIPDNVVKDKIHGAWLGRCAGCLLGKPVEGWRTRHLWPVLKDAGHESLTDYFWRLGITEDNLSKHKPGTPMFTEFDYMPVDDDTNYTIAGMDLVQQKGFDFTPFDVADFWIRRFPIHATCTAERVAYRNFVNQIFPPVSALKRNPYREWIGAQIRADVFGYIAAGKPELAANLAWRDGSISHVKNGIYGEMWVAAMLAAAAGEDDIATVIRAGLGEVPEKSRFTEGINTVLKWYEEGVSYHNAVRKIHTLWDEDSPHDWCHTISNAQVVTVSLLWSGGDFETAITRAVWPGFDTDCNGATVGSVMGMILGKSELPKKWTAPLNDTIHTSIAGYTKTTISGTAEVMFNLYKAGRDIK